MKEARDKCRGVLKHLRGSYGSPVRRGREGGVDVLVATILSQNTNGANSSEGFRRLKEKFRTWDAVAEAPVRNIAGRIRVSGLSKIKAPRIRSILRQIRTDRGRISLRFLRNRDPREAYEYLIRFNGVGPKTAWCVLLFAFGMKVFPVDTHIHRIARRLGLLEEGVSAERAHDVLAPLIAPRDRYAMHVLLIAHGRKTCLARRPRCDQCCILTRCPHGQGRGFT